MEKRERFLKNPAQEQLVEGKSLAQAIVAKALGSGSFLKKVIYGELLDRRVSGKNSPGVIPKGWLSKDH